MFHENAELSKALDSIQSNTVAFDRLSHTSWRRLFCRFDERDFSKETVKYGDRLKISENFFDGRRIQTNPGGVLKEGKFFFKYQFEHGKTITERDKFLMDY